MRRSRNSYFISAGEFSGDLLAADLVTAIRDRAPKLKCFGLAGDHMIAAGVEPIASMKDFNVMGIWEVAKKLPQIAMAKRSILHSIDLKQPAFAVLVDFPGFHMNLAEELHLRGIPVFQYVAPKLWAWGEGRAKKLREIFECILGVLPFEEEFFRKRGVPYHFVGSPHRDRVAKIKVTAADLGLPKDRPIIALLPGSREIEARLLLPALMLIAKEIRRKLPHAYFVVPVAKSLDMALVCQILGSSFPRSNSEQAGKSGGSFISDPDMVLDGVQFVRGMSLELMAVADAAVLASGTATLECALAGTPMSVIYKVSPMSYGLIKRLSKVQYASLVNLILNRNLVHEYIQDFSPAEVAKDVIELLANPARRQEVLDGYAEISSQLTEHAAFHAAGIICTKMAGVLPQSSHLRP